MTGWLSKLVALGSVLLAAALLVLQPDILEPKALLAAVLCIVILGLLASGIVPEILAAILFFLFAMLFAVASPEVIFSGFYSAALWMIFGGLILAVAVRLTGLGERIARFVAPRFGSSYFGIISGVVVIGVALSFVMPATMGRVMLLTPVVLALAERFGFSEGRPGRTGMALALGFGTFIPPFAILPANVPNIVLVGAAETLYGVVPVYGSYLLLHFPVLGILKSLAIIIVIVALFPDRPKATEPEALAPADGAEVRLWVMLVLALLLWMTDFLHHVSPAWVALGVAALCMMPRLGVVTPKVFGEQVNVAPMFYVGGVMGLGALVADSGLGGLLGQYIIDVADLQPGQDAWTFAVMTLAGTFLGPVLTNPGMPAVLTPLAGDIAQAAGLPVSTILMMIVISFSMVLLPYQAAPLVVAIQMCGVRMMDALKVCLGLMALTLIVLMPINYYWWRFLGYLQ